MSESESPSRRVRLLWIALGFVIACLVVVAALFVFRHLREESRIRFYEAIEEDDVPRIVAELERFPSLIDSTSPTLRVPGGLSIYSTGDPPLGVAVRNQSRDVFDYLIRIGVDVNDPGDARFPPIVNAAAIDDAYYFRELLTMGADPRAPDRHGHDAVYWATKFNREDLLAALANTEKAEAAAPQPPDPLRVEFSP